MRKIGWVLGYQRWDRKTIFDKKKLKWKGFTLTIIMKLWHVCYGSVIAYLQKIQVSNWKCVLENLSMKWWSMYLINWCRNMSGHALMGRPAARLEMIALEFSSYVVVCIVDKRQLLSLYVWYFFIYLCSLQKPLTRNQELFNLWLHVQTYHSRNHTKVSYLVQ